jgi:hypothetical protein
MQEIVGLLRREHLRKIINFATVLFPQMRRKLLFHIEREMGRTHVKWK